MKKAKRPSSEPVVIRRPGAKKVSLFKKALTKKSTLWLLRAGSQIQGGFMFDFSRKRVSYPVRSFQRQEGYMQTVVIAIGQMFLLVGLGFVLSRFTIHSLAHSNRIFERTFHVHLSRGSATTHFFLFPGLSGIKK